MYCAGGFSCWSIFFSVSCDLVSLCCSWRLDVFCPRTQVEGLNIPMSVGPPSVDRDNAGAECIVYDVIINPKAGTG